MGRLAVGVSVLSVVAACSQGSAAPQQQGGGPPPAMPAKIVTLAPQPIRDSSEYIGTLKSRHSITIQPQVAGQLTKIFVKSGDTVEAGKPLMQIDPARQAASVNTAEANRDAKRAELDFARQQSDRVQRLFESGAASRQDLDQAKSNLSAAKADLEALGAQIRQNQVQLEYYRIAAPAKGVVGDIPVRVGDYVTPQTMLTSLNDNGALEAYVSIPVERSGDLRPDMEVQLLDGAGTAVASGHVFFIAPSVNAVTQSILIKTDIQNAQGLLRPEQFVRARVVWGTHDGVTVPALAVQRLNGQTFVYVAEPGEGGALVAKMRPVTLGELTGDSYGVATGLKPGDKVVASNTMKLRDGAAVAEDKGTPGPAPAAAPAKPAAAEPAKPPAAGK